MRKLTTYILMTLIAGGGLFAQYSTGSKRALARFESANRNYRLLNYAGAEEDLLDALEIDEEFVEAYILLGQLYSDMNNPEGSAEAYESAIDLDPDAYPRLYYFLGEKQLLLGRYRAARKSFSTFLASGYMSEKLAIKTSKYLENCDFAIEAIRDPVPFDPVNLGPNINSEYDEYWPSLSADEYILVFTVLLPVNPDDPRMSGYRQEDFYFSLKKNGEWTPAQDAGFPLNTQLNEGAQTITGDGKTMYYTACNREDGMGLCDIYMAVDMGDSWSEPVNIGKAINTVYSEKQPSVSSDGRTLYFISDRPGGHGAYDIWYSVKNDLGGWKAPVNLGDSINTPGIDQSPFIHPDNQTLYFSSDGWPGMGGYDLFLSRKTGRGEWGRPVNLGYPINTHHHEEGLIVNAQGNKAYYSSTRMKDRGRDIFVFDLYQEARPVLVSYMKGTVFDKTSRKRLQAAFELIELETGETIMKSTSHRQTGDFLVCIPADADYALNVSKEGYLFYSDHFTVDRIYKHAEPFLMDIPLQPIRKGERIVLRNVFFDTDSYLLKQASQVELDKVIEFLNRHPGLTVEISGHTDNTGSAEHNQELSEQRAAAVVRYLADKGINETRLHARGYGMDEPVDTNDTPEGRANNRRTELKILSR